jgi:hypothetical protein
MKLYNIHISIIKPYIYNLHILHGMWVFSSFLLSVGWFPLHFAAWFALHFLVRLISNHLYNIILYSSYSHSGSNFKESSGIHPRKRKEKRHKSLSPRSLEEGKSSCTALIHGITKIGIHIAMKNHMKALRELKTQVPKKSMEGDKYRPFNK